jgi:riboflavin kinase/FMN adenylyltransferase
MLDGCVVSGTQRGSTLLGFPTANIEVLHELIPKAGVYISRVIWKEKKYSAVVNVGINPTFQATRTTVEAHLLDFDEALYGEQIKILFLKRIRDEIAFSTPQALSAQIGHDILVAKTYFQTYEA